MSSPEVNTAQWSPWKMAATGLCVMALFGAFLSWPLVRFTEEEIYITACPEYVEVTGYYIYQNPFPFPVVQGFSIPFPVDRDHPEPLAVHVVRTDKGERAIPVVELFGTCRFDLRFAANETIPLRVRYCQYAPTREARYILTTTQPWGRPMSKAKYRLYPKKVTITDSNYPLDPREGGALGFERRDFMPEADWAFAWEVP